MKSRCRVLPFSNSHGGDEHTRNPDPLPYRWENVVPLTEVFLKKEVVVVSLSFGRGFSLTAVVVVKTASLSCRGSYRVFVVSLVVVVVPFCLHPGVYHWTSNPLRLCKPSLS